MFQSVFARSIRDQRRSLTWWVIGLAATAALTMSFYPSMRANARSLDAFMKQMPDTLKAAFLGNASDFASPAGYVNARLYAFLMPLLLGTFAIAAGSRAIASEEERGTLELLLSTPVRRGAVVMQKFAGMAASSALLSAIFWGALVVSGIAVHFQLSPEKLAAATVSLWLLSVALGSLALLVGCATGNHGPAVGVAAGIGVIMYLVYSLEPVAKPLDPWRRLSFFYYYIGNDPLHNGLAPVHVGVLAGSIAVMAAGAVFLFGRRDIRAA